jgi:hypothetical protein
MIPFSAVCVFCEDIREEKSGQDTIIGTLPDNLVATKLPAPGPTANARPSLPRMGVYLRIHLDAEQDIPKEVSAKMINMDGQVVAHSTWDRSIVDKTFAESRANHMPVVALIFKVVAAPFPLTMEGGKITVVAIVDGVERIAGALNVMVSTA